MHCVPRRHCCVFWHVGSTPWAHTVSVQTLGRGATHCKPGKVWVCKGDSEALRSGGGAVYHVSSCRKNSSCCMLCRTHDYGPLQVDASHMGAGAVLLQKEEFGVEKPVSFFSKKVQLLPVKLFHHWKGSLSSSVYVGSSVVPVVVCTDHNPSQPSLILCSVLIRDWSGDHWPVFLAGHSAI